MIILLVLLIAMIWWMSRSQRKRAEQMQEERGKLRDTLEEGQWMRTTSGFYGRFVEIDGDVVVLETPGGEETLWEFAAVQKVDHPPFSQEEDSADLDAELSDLATQADTENSDAVADEEKDTEKTSSEDSASAEAKEDKENKE